MNSSILLRGVGVRENKAKLSSFAKNITAIVMSISLPYFSVSKDTGRNLECKIGGFVRKATL